MAEAEDDEARWFAVWVGRSQEGDPEAFAHLVEKLTEPLSRFAMAMLGPWQEAEDAVQEAWLRIWRRLPLLQERAAFRGWAYSITRNVCLDRLRSRARRPAEPFDEAVMEMPAPEASQPEASAVMAHEVSRAWRVLGELPLAQREAFVLVAVHGLSYEEASTAMGTTVSTLRGRLARARGSIARQKEQEVNP